MTTAKSHKHHGILTHWGRVTHICVGNLTIIGSDNGLSPGRRQAIIWTNDRILLIGPLGTNFSDIFIVENVLENVVCEMESILSRPQCVKSLVSQLFFQVLVWVNNTGNFKAPHYWPFMREIHCCLMDQWLKDSPHKGPAMQKAYQHHSRNL